MRTGWFNFVVTIAALAVISGADAHGGTISSSTCSAYGYETVTGTDSCVLGPELSPYTGVGLDSARSSALLVLASTPEQYSVLVGTEVGRAYPVPTSGVGPIGYPSSASSKLQFTAQLATSGPTRPGFLLAILSGNGGHNNGSASTNAVISTVSGANVFPTMVGCTSAFDRCESSTTALAHYNPLPFTLGQSFVLSYSGSLDVYASGLEGGYADAAMTLGFRFTELDGTAVAVSAVDTPEPINFWLVGGGFAFLFLRRVWS